MFEGRAAIGYDHGYDAQKFYFGLALDPKYVEEFVEGCLERIGEDNPRGGRSCGICGRRGRFIKRPSSPLSPPLLSLNAVAYALVYRREGS